MTFVNKTGSVRIT